MVSKDFISDRIRRCISLLVATIIPNSNQLKSKVRCLKQLYKLFDSKKSTENRVILYYADGSPDCPGLADRLKAMVTGYSIARKNCYNYYIFHHLGFKIEDYLIPNEINWLIEKKDICLGLNHLRFLWFTTRIEKLDPRYSEYHLHFAQDSTESLTEEDQEEYNFSKLFHQLFKPTDYLKGLIDKTRNRLQIDENGYIAVHVRFLDFFETVESKRDTAFTKHARAEEQAEMIHSIQLTLQKLHTESGGLPILLLSDSNTFLNTEHAQYIHTIPGEVGHIYSKEGNKEITDRAFIDMFLISEAKLVYNIIGPGTYASGYSYMGARIGSKPFSRVNRLIPM